MVVRAGLATSLWRYDKRQSDNAKTIKASVAHKNTKDVARWLESKLSLDTLFVGNVSASCIVAANVAYAQLCLPITEYIKSLFLHLTCAGETVSRTFSFSRRYSITKYELCVSA